MNVWAALWILLWTNYFLSGTPQCRKNFPFNVVNVSVLSTCVRHIFGQCTQLGLQTWKITQVWEWTLQDVVGPLASLSNGCQHGWAKKNDIFQRKHFGPIQVEIFIMFVGQELLRFLQFLISKKNHYPSMSNKKPFNLRDIPA